MSFSDQQLKDAKAFVDLLKHHPDIIHHPSLGFFKEYLVSLDAKIPEQKKKPEPEPVIEEQPEAEAEPAEPVEQDPDLWQPDPSASQEMGNPSKEVSDDDNSTSMGYFSEARQLAASQSFEAAIAKYTEAILANPTKAVFFANRAECFLRLKKPNAAIKDATRALEINPDQAKAYKVRGTARRYLGYYEDALHDLYASQKVDFDEDTDQIARSIKERVDTLVARRRERERKAEEAERKRKIAEYERRKKAAEEARKRAEEEASGGLGGMGGMPGMGGMGGMGGMPGMGGLSPDILQQVLSDPDVREALNDPATAAKLSQIMSNPAAAMQHMSDPKIAKILQKLMPMFSQAPTGFGPGDEAGAGAGAAGGVEDFDID